MSYATRHDWIELVFMPERRDRQFAAKAHAFNSGYERRRDMSFDRHWWARVHRGLLLGGPDTHAASSIAGIAGVSPWRASDPA